MKFREPHKNIRLTFQGCDDLSSVFSLDNNISAALINYSINETVGECQEEFVTCERPSKV